MMRDETLDQFEGRLENAKWCVDCALGIVRAIRTDPAPARKAEQKIGEALEDLRCRALDFLTNSERERREHI